MSKAKRAPRSRVDAARELVARVRADALTGLSAVVVIHPDNLDAMIAVYGPPAASSRGCRRGGVG